MAYDPEDMKFRRLDGNHGYCATRCPECGGASEVYIRDLDELFWCMECDCHWVIGPDRQPQYVELGER